MAWAAWAIMAQSITAIMGLALVLVLVLVLVVVFMQELVLVQERISRQLIKDAHRCLSSS